MSAWLRGAATPLTVGVCADRGDTRRPNTPAAIAAHAMPGRWSGRRTDFWVQAFQGDERVGDRHQGHVVVPALEGAALEVVQAERVLELSVVVLHSPAQLGQTHELAQGDLGGQGGQPVLDRLGSPSGHSASSQRTGSSPPRAARRSLIPAGRTRSATNREASGWPSAPSRQATVRAAWSPAASTSCRSEERRCRYRGTG